MKSNRENGLDLMRIIAAVFVVMVHCGALLYVNAAELDTAAISLYMVLAVFAKSCVSFFFMVSGAFLLSSPRTQDIKAFYKKTFKRLCVPTIVFLLLYFAYDIAQTLMIGGDISTCFDTFVRGESGVHLWFMFVMIGLYLAAPMIQHLKDKISLRAFTVTAVVLVLVGFLGESTSPHYLDWDLGFIGGSLGVFMLGYSLYTKLHENKSAGKAVLFLIPALVITFVQSRLMFNRVCGDVPVLKDLFSMKDQSPIIALIAVLLMAFALSLPIKKSFHKLGALTYGVYLVHLFFVYIGKYVFSAVKGVPANALVLSIPEFLLMSVIVSVVSFAVTALFYKVFGKKKTASKEAK